MTQVVGNVLIFLNSRSWTCTKGIADAFVCPFSCLLMFFVPEIKQGRHGQFVFNFNISFVRLSLAIVISMVMNLEKRNNAEIRGTCTTRFPQLGKWFTVRVDFGVGCTFISPAGEIIRVLCQITGISNNDVVSPSFFLPPCAIIDQPQTEGESFNATDIKDFAASRCGFPWCRPKYIWSCIVHRKICTIYGTWCCYRSMMVAHFPVYHANTTSDIFSFGIVLETLTLYVACTQSGLQRFAN